MALVSLQLPPGVYRMGTEYQSKGRFYDAWLVRWYDQSVGPIGGWRPRGVTDVVNGAARACLAWRGNDGTQYIGIGSHEGLFASTLDGAIFDITPNGFTTGRADAKVTSGFGFGPFGGGPFGTPRIGVSITLDATVWTLQLWGQFLLGANADDGKIYQWELNTGTKAAKVANSPQCRAIVVTPEGFVFALGTVDQRTVSWCDQQDNTSWTPTLTNQAGNFPLQTIGKLMCGEATKAGTLLHTDVDVWLAVYIGGEFIYSFGSGPIGTNCGVISQAAVAQFDGQVVWMTKSGFKLYNGYVQDLPCDVWDYVFRDINKLQWSKAYAVTNSANKEVEFYYCSGSSTEIDRCVIWNYEANHWNIGRTPRLCGVDRGAFAYPIKVDSDGIIYEHEVGLQYDGTFPYAEGGPLELGQGDQVMEATSLIRDDDSGGSLNLTIFKRFHPAGNLTTYGPISLANGKTDVRFSARQVSVRYDGTQNTDWRVGAPRLDVTSAGFR